MQIGLGFDCRDHEWLSLETEGGRFTTQMIRLQQRPNIAFDEGYPDGLSKPIQIGFEMSLRITLERVVNVFILPTLKNVSND